MSLTDLKTLSRKLLVLGILVAALVCIDKLTPRNSNAQSSNCDSEVFQYCFAQNRPVNPYTCECEFSACIMPVASDCTEVGNYLDTSTCTCVSNPSYIGMCDNDPYALGCPRSFDTVFASQLRTLSSTFVGSEDICSFESFAWCNANGGSWSSYGCACSGIVGSGSTAQARCTAAQGVWNPNNGGACHNPMGIDLGFECNTSTQTLSSCVASGGYWNPYRCKCTPPV